MAILNKNAFGAVILWLGVGVGPGRHSHTQKLLKAVGIFVFRQKIIVEGVVEQWLNLSVQGTDYQRPEYGKGYWVGGHHDHSPNTDIKYIINEIE